WSLGSEKAGEMARSEAPKPLLYSRVRSSFMSKHRKGKPRSVYSVVGLLKVPHSLSDHAICMTARLWFSCSSWPRVKCTMAMKNFVRRDSRFITACAAGDLETTRQMTLAGHGAPSNIDEFGKPALHHAIDSGSVELVSFLLYHGATPDDLDSQLHVSPLQQACMHGHLDIARLLLAKGAFLEHEDLGGRSAFTMLWFHPSPPFSRVELMKVLLTYSPIASILDPPNGFGPLSCAALRGTVEEMEILMHAGAYQEKNDSAGDRIIRYSVIGCNTATYDLLLPLMPPGWISELDQRGRGMLHLALEYPNANIVEMVQRLLLAGADVHQKDAEGREPGDLARICDQRAIAADSQLPGVPSNFAAYFEGLRSFGINGELDDDGNLRWPSEDTSVEKF
ncbi:MAG: hypothetical protein Q9174_001907, partial [Haloplaca sp. 1 TL-2023]